MSTPKPEVKVGQIWADCDRRMGGRVMRVVRFDDEYAYLEPPHRATTRTVRIAIRRMRPTSTGWRLIQDVNS